MIIRDVKDRFFVYISSLGDRVGRNGYTVNSLSSCWCLTLCLKYSYILGQFCGIAKMRFISFYAAFCVFSCSNNAMFGDSLLQRLNAKAGV